MIAHALGDLIRGAIYVAIAAFAVALLVRALALPWWLPLLIALVLVPGATSILVAAGAGVIARRRRLRDALAGRAGGVLFDLPAWAMGLISSAGRGDAGVVIGRGQGHRVAIPAGGASGSHTLVVGATGSGKTVTQALIAERLIAAGLGAIAVDPKGDGELRERLAGAAAERGARFVEWTPDGPTIYNPYGSGSPDELADKALAGEHFSEPHYLRQAQRYVGHAVRALHAASVPVTPQTLLANMTPAQLERTARDAPDAAALNAYLDGLTERQERELAGVRDRLAIVAEAEVGRWLEPAAGFEEVQLEQLAAERAVLYVRLDADRRPLVAQMLGVALTVDLVSLVARHQGSPLHMAVLIDEFAAVAAEPVVRLFARGRAAGVSVVLGAQEIADLQAAGRRLDAQVLGNVGALVAHRQNTPDSAELLSRMAGEERYWQPTRHEKGLVPVSLQSISRRRVERRRVSPDELRGLPVGRALVLVAGAAPRIVAVQRPSG